jgi:hypothetical protein
LSEIEKSKVENRSPGSEMLIGFSSCAATVKLNPHNNRNKTNNLFNTWIIW